MSGESNTAAQVQYVIAQVLQCEVTQARWRSDSTGPFQIAAEISDGSGLPGESLVGLVGGASKALVTLS